MSHPRLESHRRQYQTKANGVRAQLRQAVQREQARRDLTADQQRRNVGHLRRQAEGRLEALRREYLAGTTNVLKALRMPLYRLSTSNREDMSWRDAMTRASSIDSQDEALRMLDVALMVNDTVMVRALGYVAAPSPEEHPPKWPAVVAAWKRSDPAVADTLAAYDDVWAELQDQQVKFEDAAMFAVPAPQQPPDTDTLPRLEPVTSEPAHEPATTP